MKTVAIVPIKFNSERVKNKNIKKFTNGKPLCCYIFETLKKVKEIDKIYVFCSDEKIIDYIPKGVIFLKRDKSLDSSTTKINEVLRSFSEKVDSDYYVLTHATAPFIKSETINECLEKVKYGEYDSSFTVEKLQTFLWEDNEPINYNLNDIPRTQDLNPIYVETSGLYIFNRETILKHNRRIGNNPYMKEISKIEAIDIDENEDFFIADAVYNHLERLGK